METLYLWYEVCGFYYFYNYPTYILEIKQIVYFYNVQYKNVILYSYLYNNKANRN